MSGPTRILVVDDEQSITDFIALGLRHEGFEVRTAPDGHTWRCESSMSSSHTWSCST